MKNCRVKILSEYQSLSFFVRLAVHLPVYMFGEFFYYYFYREKNLYTRGAEIKKIMDRAGNKLE